MELLAAIALLQATNKTAIAEGLLAHKAELTTSGFARLTALGNEAFPPVLSAFQRESARIDSHGVPGQWFPDGPELRTYTALLSALKQVSSRKRGRELLAALKHAPQQYFIRDDLIKLVQHFSAQKEVVPYFLACLRHPHPGADVLIYNLADSSDPRAINFMLKRLGDPSADRETRELAYSNLARTGGEKLAKTVYRARLKAKSSLRPPKTDAEQVVAAAFEARFHFVKNNTAGIFVVPSEVSPFALAGWNGPLTWQSGLARTGVEISLVPRSASSSKWEEKFISWDAARTGATVNVETISGSRLIGIEYTLKKFAFGWVVVRAFHNATS